MIQVDMVTVLMASALVSSTLALAFLILGMGVLRSHALTLWGLAHGCWGLGLALLLTRGLLPDLAAILIPNGLLVLGQGVAWCGARTHLGRRAPWSWVFGGLVVFLLLFVWFTRWDPNIAARIIIVRLFIAAFTLTTIACLWPKHRGKSWRGQALASASFMPHAFLMLVTAGMGLFYWDPAAPFMSHPVIVVSVALGVIAHLLWGLGVLLMTFERLVHERATADTVFQALAEQNLVGLYELRNGVVTYANAKMCRMFGYAEEEAIGLSSLALLIAPEDRERVNQLYEARDRGLTDVSRYTFTGLRRDGERFQLEVQGTVVRRDADATVIMGVALDVTDRIAAERALVTARDTLERRVAERTRALEEDARERAMAAKRPRAFAMVIEQSAHMVLLTDARGRVEYVNARYSQVHGVDDRDVQGRDVATLIPSDRSREVASAIQDTRSWRGEFPLYSQGRKGWIDAILTPIRDEDGKTSSFVLIQTDISERKDVERNLARAKDLAELASRSKTELLANMSYELRPPLNALIGITDLMRRHAFGPLGDARYDGCIRDIGESGAHLLEQINDILDVAAPEARDVKPREETVALTDLVDSALRLVADRARRADLTIRVDLGVAQRRSIRVDPRRFKQVLLNLLSNAVKFTPAGGALSLTTRLHPDGSLTLSLSDTGMGMSKEEIAIALSRFDQVDGSFSRRRDGTGLGLPLTQDLLSMHGATLVVESEPGMGTTVSFTLPPERVVTADAATTRERTPQDIEREEAEVRAQGQEERLWV